MSTTIWPDSETLATIASVIGGFAVSMLVFRISRELKMKEKGEPNWIPCADWLMIGAALLSLVCVILPLVAVPHTSAFHNLIPPAACAAAAVLVAGYVFAILAHYRLILRGKRRGLRDNPERPEGIIVCVTVLVAISVGVWTLFIHS